MSTERKAEPSPEEDIDTETLQAQIDMSMSLAHDVVASWMSPSDRARLGRASDPKRLVEEQLRRPARLGVGASTPELVQASREAAKLRHQLVSKGKKRTREEGVPAHQADLSDNDEELAKGRIASKKQAKVDPFARKKKKAPPTEQNGTGPPQSIFRVISDGMDVDDSVADGTDSTPLLVQNVDAVFSSTKRRRKQGANDLGTPRSPGEMNAVTSSDMVFSIPKTPIEQHELSRSSASQSSSPARSTARINLLNLDGPVGISEDPDKNSESKKKRKRRKKKKHHDSSLRDQPE